MRCVSDTQRNGGGNPTVETLGDRMAFDASGDDGGGMANVLPPPQTSTYVPPTGSGSGAGAGAAGQTLVRPREGRYIAGVCAGIADRYGWDPTIVRLVAVLSIFLPGPQVLAYLVLWLVMPSDDA